VLRFPCSTCGRSLRVAEELAGQAVLCPQCHAVATAPGKPRPAPKPAQRETKPVADAEEPHAADIPLAKPSQTIDPEELIDMTAMVDIVFFLLIFFLVTSMSGLNSSMHLPNPEARAEEGGPGPKAADEPEADGDFIIVQVNRDDSLEVDGIQVPDIPALLIRLQQLRGAGSRNGVLIVGHGNATHGTTVEVLDTCYEAGMERVRLAISGDQPE
jgi:biopolymer transport protein ExbD